MQIKTQRLTLEPLGTKFLVSTHAYASDPELTRLMVFLPTDDLAETTAVMLDGRHIGSVSAYLEENGTAWELGWIISRDAHGCGYAAEAARALMEYCLETTGIRRFIAHCDSENSASQRVMQKLGLSFAEERSGRKNRGSDEVRSEMMFERVF